MKKLESSLKNMALALTGFSVIAGGVFRLGKRRYSRTDCAGECQDIE